MVSVGQNWGVGGWEQETNPGCEDGRCIAALVRGVFSRPD